MKKIKKYLAWIYTFLNRHIFRKILKRDLSSETFFQLIKHYMVGFIGAVLNYLSFNLILLTGLGIKVSNILAYIIVIIVSFILQKYFTYKVKRNSIWQPILFVVNGAVYYILDTVILIFFIDHLFISPWISKVISIAILFPISFLFQKFIVFKKTKVKNAG